MQPAQEPTPPNPLATFQPVLPQLTTILTHITAQNTLLDRYQAQSGNGALTEPQEEELRTYEEKISKQAMQVRRSLLDQARTAYTPHVIPGSQYSIEEMEDMDRALDERMQERGRVLEQFMKMELPVSKSLRG